MKRLVLVATAGLAAGLGGHAAAVGNHANIPARGKAAIVARRPHAARAAMVVGWHDEMNDLTTWKPREGGMPPDIFSTRPGALTLRLPHSPEGFPYAYQWGGVTRMSTVDLSRYPLLVARFIKVRTDSYCHLDVEQLDYGGRAAHTLRTPTLQAPGLSVLDLGKEYGPYTWRLAIRINVGGALTGAECECSWVRFVSRKDLPTLQARPDWQRVDIKP